MLFFTKFIVSLKREGCCLISLAKGKTSTLRQDALETQIICLSTYYSCQDFRSFYLVMGTWSFYLHQAQYPIEKHNCWLRNRLIREKLESSIFAQRAVKKPDGKLDIITPPRLLGGFSVPPQLFSPWQHREFLSCFSLYREKKKKNLNKHISERLVHERHQ